MSARCRYVLLTLALTLLAHCTGGRAAEPHRRPFTDADLRDLPSRETLEVLSLRGQRAYGSDQVTDEGIRHLTRYPRLRVLHAGGLGLTDQALGKLALLEELRLNSNQITAEGLRHLVGLKKLRRLNLSFNPLGADAFATLAMLTGLTELSVIGSYSVDDRVLEHCGRLTKLEKLRLSEKTAAVSDRGLEHLSRLKRLKSLALRDADKISDAGLARLAQLSHLEQLDLQNLRSITPAGLKVLEKLPELRRLEIEDVRMNGETLQSLAPLQKVEYLLLWGVSSGPLPLEMLGELQSLRELRTNQTLSSTAIRALAGLEHLESIRDELTEITDEDLTHLARLPKLRILVLGSDQITAASLPTLAKMHSLRRLYVTEHVQITPEQWTTLGELSLAQCHIRRFRPPYTVYHEPVGEKSDVDERPYAGASNKPAADPTIKLWAAVAASHPILAKGSEGGAFMLHFALVNDGNEAVSPELGSSQLLINGKELEDWPLIIGNGPRDDRWKSLPPGDYLSFGYALGKYFEEPGTYNVLWKGKGFESPEITFRVMPKTEPPLPGGNAPLPELARNCKGALVATLLEVGDTQPGPPGAADYAAKWRVTKALRGAYPETAHLSFRVQSLPEKSRERPPAVGQSYILITYEANAGQVAAILDADEENLRKVQGLLRGDEESKKRAALWQALLLAAGLQTGSSPESEWKPLPLDEICEIYESRTLSQAEIVAELVSHLDQRLSMPMPMDPEGEAPDLGRDLATLIDLLGSQPPYTKQQSRREALQHTIDDTPLGVKHEKDVRRYLYLALGLAGGEVPEDQFVSFLRDPKTSRQILHVTLNSMSRSNVPIRALPRLLELADHPWSYVHHTGVGPPTSERIYPIRKAVFDCLRKLEIPKVRLETAIADQEPAITETIVRVDRKALLEKLETWIESNDPAVWGPAIDALRQLRRDDLAQFATAERLSASQLMEGLSSPARRERAAAAEKLRFSRRTIVEHLQTKLQTMVERGNLDRSYEGETHLVLRLIGQWRVGESVDELTEIVAFELDGTTFPVGAKFGPEAYFPAAMALAAIGDGKVVAAMLGRIAKADDPKTIRTCTWVLSYALDRDLAGVVLKHAAQMPTTKERKARLEEALRLLKQSKSLLPTRARKGGGSPSEH